ncbi:hypothetical protein JCM6882_009260 [Rhodosporidiobolus microsporus]
MPQPPLRSNSYRTANLSDDSIDGLDSPPQTAGYRRDGERRRGGMSGGESEDEREYPTRSHHVPSRAEGSDQLYSNPFSDASGLSSASDDERRSPSAGQARRSSRQAGPSRSRRGGGDEEQMLASLGHRDEESEDDGGGGSRGHHVGRKARKLAKRAGCGILHFYTGKAKWLCWGVLALAVIIAITVGVVLYKTSN